MSYESRYEAALASLADHHSLDVRSDFFTVDVPPVDRVHYLVAGEGPPLFFLHGVGVAASNWIPLLADLAEEYTCYALDRPGRGLSDPLDHTAVDFRSFDADLLAAFLDGVGVDACPVIGNSFGGFQALTFALDRPSKVESLALLGAPAGLSGDYPLAMRLGSLPVIGPKLVALAEPNDIAGARKLFGRAAVVHEEALSKPLLETYLAELDPPGRTASLASVFRDTLRIRGARPSAVIRKEIPGVEQPTLFVWGSEDQFFPPTVGRPVAAAMPDAQFVELDGVGHAPWLEPDDRTAAKLRSFLG